MCCAHSVWEVLYMKEMFSPRHSWLRPTCLWDQRPVCWARECTNHPVPIPPESKGGGRTVCG